MSTRSRTKAAAAGLPKSKLPTYVTPTKKDDSLSFHTPEPASKTSPILEQLASLNNTLTTPAIQTTIDNVIEELAGVQKSVHMLSLNAQHLLIDPGDVLAKVDKCAFDVTELKTLVNNMFTEINTKLDSIIAQHYNPTPNPRHEYDAHTSYR